MAGDQVFTSRLKGRPLLDSEGLTIGRIRDVVILPSGGNDPPSSGCASHLVVFRWPW